MVVITTSYVHNELITKYEMQFFWESFYSNFRSNIVHLLQTCLKLCSVVMNLTSDWSLQREVSLFDFVLNCSIVFFFIVF